MIKNIYKILMNDEQIIKIFLYLNSINMFLKEIFKNI